MGFWLRALSLGLRVDYTFAGLSVLYIYIYTYVGIIHGDQYRCFGRQKCVESFRVR